MHQQLKNGQSPVIEEYQDKYPTIEKKEIKKNLSSLLQKENVLFINPSSEKITRKIINSSKPEKECNVIIVLMESLDASSMKAFNNRKNLTPNLDAIASQSLLFTNHFSCGISSTEGSEATTLLKPRSPGLSAIKQADNDQLFTIGTPFKKRDYKLVYFTPGKGSFDNLSTFYKKIILILLIAHIF